MNTTCRLGWAALAAITAIGCKSEPKKGPEPAVRSQAPVTSAVVPVPVKPPPAPAVVKVKDIALGGDASFAFYTDGKVKVWGAAKNGALGLGKTDKQPEPTEAPLLVGADQIWSQGSFTCVRFKDQVKCFGRNFGGVLGNGTTSDTREPTPIKLTQKITELSCGGTHCGVRLEDGAVYQWGMIVAGVGSKPWKVEKVSSASALGFGGDHSCALHADGKATCWDLMFGMTFDYGAAVNGQDGNLKTPTVVKDLSDAVSISVSDHACIVHKDATVSCWGYGDSGQLGDGRFGENYAQHLPKKVPGLDNVVQVSAGGGFTCALQKSGNVSCWGTNEWGQLGVGDTKRRAKPEQLTGLGKVVRIATGAKHACAVKDDATVMCWGGNTDGQVGDATSGVKNARRLVPTAVKL